MEANDRKLRLAVVGCGAVAAIHHLPALSLCRSAEAVVLVDADPGRARDLAARFGVPETSTDVRSLPGRVDAAIVALPNSLHAPVSIDLLRQGVHVLVEKPMALNVRECDAMIAAADRSMSSSVVDQFEIEMRIAACPCHFVPPTQHVPSSCTRAMTFCVSAAAASSSPPGSLNCTRTWLRTTSLRIRMSSRPARCEAIRMARVEQRSTISRSI